MTIPRTGVTVLTGAAAILLMQQGIDLLTPIGFNHIQSHQFSFTAPAHAVPRYVPRSGSRAPRRTQGTGSRGCNNATPVALTLLVPQEQTGFTTSDRPTFFWHLSAPAPVVFTITQQGNPKPLLEQRLETATAGINEFRLPTSQPELKLSPDTKYRWSVQVVCNQRFSQNVFVQAWIRREVLSPELATKLANATSDLQKAEIYAQAGLWYDVLGAMATVRATQPQNQAILKERLALLEQVGLTEVVKQETQRLSRNP